MRPWFLGLAILASTSGAAIDAADGNTMARGPGTSTCGKFAESYALDPDMFEGMFFAWAQGFMTATNVAWASTQGKYRDLSGNVETQQMFIRQYCDKHPLAMYLEAVNALYKTLPFKALEPH